MLKGKISDCSQRVLFEKKKGRGGGIGGYNHKNLWGNFSKLRLGHVMRKSNKSNTITNPKHFKIYQGNFSKLRLGQSMSSIM